MITDVLIIEPMYAMLEAGKDLLVRSSADFLSGSPVVLREPIAAEYIAAYLKKMNLSVDIIQQTKENDNELLEIIGKKSPKILGISIHSSHIFSKVDKFVNKCKKRFPDMVIICGGNHPSCVADILRNKNIDYVARGEGEEVMYEFSKLVLSGKSPNKVKGLSYLKNGKIVNNDAHQRFDFSQSLWPIRKKDILSKIKCAPLAYPNPDKQRSATQIAYSRGCPFKCEFCVSPLIFPGNVIYRKPNDVVREIKYLQKTFGTNFLFFTDLTFNSNGEKVIELCDEIIKNKVNINWFAYCSMHLNNHVVEKMADAGCTRIGTGAESLIPDLLKQYKSQQTIDDVRKSLMLANQHGILNRVYIMLGYPEETKDMLKETLEVMKTLPIDQPRIAFITPFPGTLFYNKMKKSLFTNNIEEFTGDKPIIKNANINREEYIKIRDDMVRAFYNSKEYKEHIENTVVNHAHLKESYKYFMKYLLDKNIISKDSYSKINIILK